MPCMSNQVATSSSALQASVSSLSLWRVTNIGPLPVNATANGTQPVLANGNYHIVNRGRSVPVCRGLIRVVMHGADTFGLQRMSCISALQPLKAAALPCRGASCFSYLSAIACGATPPNLIDMYYGGEPSCHTCRAIMRVWRMSEACSSTLSAVCR